MSKEIGCFFCVHCEQGSGCSFCSNPKQTNKDFKQYVAPAFICTLFEEGESKSRKQYMIDNP